ncbi:alpha carbonic anhydrase 4 [Ricinus communis]|uniref:alpha carbonic anhydrase 4 n=1 Tax=Ricinus communis TaxID=3988 RepID=UPI00201AA356|nr:alpha carbonic anhydrase 4 [Ricinus communis]
MKARTVIFFLLTSLPFFFESSIETNEAGPTEFRYDEPSGRGPSRWGELNPLWRICGTGNFQSPINLQFPILSPTVGDLQIAYRPAPATIRNTGPDITVSWTGNPGTIRVAGINYPLRHGHWHTPTEHLINGTRFDLEFHLFHHIGTHGIPVIIGILYRIGEADPFLTRLLPNITSVTKEERSLGIIDPNDIGFNSSRRYYRYYGSLTSPPCREGVKWIVFQEVRTASQEQVQALMNAVDDGFEMNARPVQALNGRRIDLYNRN